MSENAVLKGPQASNVSPAGHLACGGTLQVWLSKLLRMVDFRRHSQAEDVPLIREREQMQQSVMRDGGP